MVQVIISPLLMKIDWSLASSAGRVDLEQMAVDLWTSVKIKLFFFASLNKRIPTCVLTCESRFSVYRCDKIKIGLLH